MSQPQNKSILEQGFSLRDARAEDENSVRTLMQTGNMGLANDWQDAIVAVNAAGYVIGYIRIEATDKGPHVAPVAVFPAWQGRGVGRALIEAAIERHGDLKLVSRGEAAGFYRALGAREISFEDVAPCLGEDCNHCPDREACQPVAFTLSKGGHDD